MIDELDLDAMDALFNQLMDVERAFAMVYAGKTAYPLLVAEIRRLRKEIETLRIEKETLLSIIQECAADACIEGVDPGTWDTAGVQSTNRAVRALAENGLLEIVSDDGETVIARDRRPGVKGEQP